MSRRLLLTVLALAALGAWAWRPKLPTLEGRSASTVLRDTADTRLGRSIEPLVGARPGQAGIVALAQGRDAFAARSLLADAADKTLDVQYYIWHADMSGTLLFEALHRAADRGVRVRLLLDDNNTVGLDALLAALDAHADIEVRLFNPFMHRRWRALGYLTDFPRLNRRMHNKSFTADNQVTIVGGRNVGDEYFGAGQAPLFVDLDVMAVGPVVDEVSQDFDRYWASASAYPAARMLPAAEPASLSALAEAASLVERDPAAREYMEAIRSLPFVHALLDGSLPLAWATTHLVSDDPAKGLGRAAPESLLPQRFAAILGVPAKEIDLVSPYFVPTAAGVAYFADLARRGVKVRVLTNSLEATDVAAVHAGYAKRRRALLEAGVELFEMKRMALTPLARDHGLTGSSGTSLHAKTFAVDGARVFVGSFNFDPRSVQLNTEMGVVIDSPVMARQVAQAFESAVPQTAYRVRLGTGGELQWVEQRDGGQVVHDTEPGAGFWLRATLAVLARLPIEWLL